MSLQLTVPEIACVFCVDTIVDTLREIDPKAMVYADFKNKTIEVEIEASKTTVKEAIAAAGYAAF